VSAAPDMMWRFKDDIYSANTWGKPIIGKVLINDPNNAGKLLDKWVVVLTGGFAYNHQNSDDSKGKALFVVDAANGDLLWMIGYDANAIDDNGATDELDVDSSDTIHYLTKAEIFNYSVPSSVSVVDSNFDGYIDAIYFGNVGGNMFKTNLMSQDKTEWKTYLLYKSETINGNTDTITAVDGNKMTISDYTGFTPGDLIMGSDSKAFAYVTIAEKVIGVHYLTIEPLAGTLTTEVITVKNYDPIFISPAIARDNCDKTWVTFGTGDRDRPKSNPSKGRFVAFVDDGDYSHFHTSGATGNLIELTWTDDKIDALADGIIINHGWYFDFPDDSEKMFDPEPIILPDDDGIPHIYFNTFQPDLVVVANKENPCNVDEGAMNRYDITIVDCLPVVIDGERQTGRIAGGGMYTGGEYITYTSASGRVADVPISEKKVGFEAGWQKFYHPGGVVFLREVRK